MLALIVQLLRNHCPGWVYGPVLIGYIVSTDSFIDCHKKGLGSLKNFV